MAEVDVLQDFIADAISEAQRLVGIKARAILLGDTEDHKAEEESTLITGPTTLRIIDDISREIVSEAHRDVCDALCGFVQDGKMTPQYAASLCDKSENEFLAYYDEWRLSEMSTGDQ